MGLITETTRSINMIGHKKILKESYNYDDIYERILDMEIVSSETLECVTDLMGKTIPVLNKIIEWSVGSSSIEEYMSEIGYEEE